MRKYIRIITALMLIMSVLILAGCGSNTDSAEGSDASEDEIRSWIDGMK